MKEMIFGTTAAYASGITSINDINSLADGSIACIEDHGALVDALAPAPTGDYVRFYLGRTTYGVYRSCLVARRNFKYDKTSYSAPVAKIIQLGSEGANTTPDLNMTTVAAGVMYTIQIIDLEKDVYDNTRNHIFSYTAIAGDTNVTVITDLVAQINADTYCPCTATDSSAGGPPYTDCGITLTGRSYSATLGFVNGHKFGVSCMDGLLNANIVEAKNNSGTSALVNGLYCDASTTPTLATAIGSATSVSRSGSKGLGDDKVLAVLEKAASAENGNTDRWFLENPYIVPSRVVASQSYEVYTLTWTEDSDTAQGVQHISPRQALQLIVPNASALETALDSILAVL